MLALIVRVSKKKPAILWSIAALILALAFRDISIPFLDVQTSFGFYFLVGALAAAAIRKESLTRLAKSPWLSGAVFAAAAVILTDFDTAYGFRCGLVLAAFFMPLALGNSFFGMLTQRPLILLGEISYSIYLIHGAVLYVAFDVLFPRFMAPTTPTWALTAGLSAVAVTTVLTSWLTYSTIEKPCIAWGRRIGRRLTNHAV